MIDFKFALRWAAVLVLGFGLVRGAAAASLLPAAGSGNANEPIEIVADRLTTNDAEKYAEFAGNVKAVQGKFSLTSDTLRIYYEGDLVNPPKDVKPPKDSKGNKDSIKKIIAGGKVHIETDEYVADTQRAEYVLETDVLTLSGAQSKVVSGKNSLSGSKIILDRGKGTAYVESSGNERVKAVFYQEPKEKDAEGSKSPKAPAAKN